MGGLSDRLTATHAALGQLLRHRGVLRDRGCWPVAGNGGLGAQELTPGHARALRDGVEAVLFEDSAHRGSSDPQAETGELAGDAAVAPMGAGNSAVVVGPAAIGPMLSPRVPNLVPIPGPRWSAKPLVSAHDRIMGTHRLGPTTTTPRRRPPAAPPARTRATAHPYLAGGGAAGQCAGPAASRTGVS